MRLSKFITDINNSKESDAIKAYKRAKFVINDDTWPKKKERVHKNTIYKYMLYRAQKAELSPDSIREIIYPSDYKKTGGGFQTGDIFKWDDNNYFYVNGDSSRNVSMVYKLYEMIKDKDSSIENIEVIINDTIRNLGGNKLQEINKENEIAGLIEDGAKQIILTGAPGTGKTYIAKNVAKKEGTYLTWKNGVNGEYPKYEFVQFHPSYDYTDFVEGLRPVEDEKGEIKFQKVDGIFKKFCRKVIEKNEKEKKYFFIIDEINRADLSKVFGELMYCLESDKRGANNKIQTQYANLPTYNPDTKSKYEPDTNEDKYNLDVFVDGFYIPENVYIIGTMNDIDRSVESMDFALRRRFVWKEIEVPTEKGELKAKFKEMFKTEEKLKGKLEDFADEIENYIREVNNKISERPELNKHYYISQGQFANIPGGFESNKNNEKDNEKDGKAIAKDYIEQVWELRLQSLLYEYVRGEGNEEEFVKSCEYENLCSDESDHSDDKGSGEKIND